jgi:putative ABC transport system ATP-binding protein
MLCIIDSRIADTGPMRGLPDRPRMPDGTSPRGASLSLIAVTLGSTQPLLEGADWNVRAGSQVAVTGPAGAGKTALLEALAGIKGVRAGAIRWAGVDCTRLSHPQREAWRRRTLGCVFASAGLFPTLDVLQNVMAPATFGGWAPSAAERAAAEELLHRAGVRPKARIEDLTRAERIRVAIVRAVWPRPRALLMDEPLVRLDARAAETTRRLLQQLACEAGATLIVATRNRELAATFEDSFAIANGRLDRVE